MTINYKLFAKLHIFTVLLLIIGYSYLALNYKNLYMNQEYPMWNGIKKIINTKSISYYNFLFIGDSRAKVGFKPNIFDNKELSSINLAVGGGTPIEGYYTLLNYLENNNSPSYLLLSYAPIHLIKQDSFWGRTVRFNFLNDKELESIITSAKILEADNETIGNKEKLVDFKINTSKYFIEFANGVVKRRWLENEEISEYLLNSKGHYYFGNADYADGLNAESTIENFKPSKVLNHYFEELLKLANNNSIKIYYYTMPFNESSYVVMNKDFQIQHDNYIDNLANKYNMNVLNKLNFLPDSDFGDPSHLYNGVDKVSLDIKEKFIKSLN